MHAVTGFPKNGQSESKDKNHYTPPLPEPPESIAHSSNHILLLFVYILLLILIYVWYSGLLEIQNNKLLNAHWLQGYSNI